MADDGPDSLILRYLREIDRKVDLMRADISDLKSRMTALEAQIATVNGRLDRVEMTPRCAAPRGG